MSGKRLRADNAAGDIKPPLVTLVLINWNYAVYLGAAIQSALAQDYPFIEIIVVDNNSTDGSRDLINQYAGKDLRIRCIALPENLGQLGAFFHIFGETRGEFVTIVDADDCLLSSFVSRHVQAHLALPQAVAFTSSNVFEIDAEGRVITGGYGVFGKGQDGRIRHLPRADAVPRLPTVSDRDYRRLALSTSAIPYTEFGWFWGPGTANMFRRSVLKMARQERGDAPYLRAADAYLNPLCHALAGSALIWEQLSFYRMHDKNFFALRESMNDMKVGRPEIEETNHRLRCETIEFLFQNVDRFLTLVDGDRYWGMIDQISMEPESRTVFRRPDTLKVLTQNYPTLRRAFGEKFLCRQLRIRMRPKLLRAVLRAAHGGRIPLKLQRTLLKTSIRRRIAKWRVKHVTGAGVLPKRAPIADQRRGLGPIQLLSRHPPVFLTGIAFDGCLGIATAFGEQHGDVPAGFIIYPTWSIERKERSAQIAAAAAAHRDRNANHRLLFMCNTKQEADLLSVCGQPAIHLNKNVTVSEKIFRPLPNAAAEFDAIYNARFLPEKRHELAALIDRVGYLGYIDDTAGPESDQARLLKDLLARHPRHALLNPKVNGVPVVVPHAQVNAALNRAAVGLCLSELEGSSYASMEYMLAGLPVVSTPNVGGRDVFFDPDYCITCEPDPISVRDAVESLKVRNIPRDEIRARTLAKIEPERRRFLAIVDDLVESLGGAPPVATRWPFEETSGIRSWDTFQNHLLAFERDRDIAAMADENRIGIDILTADLDGVQLHPAELRPIVKAIRFRPRCALLVFGCGAEAGFWEKINRDGTTAFLEDDPEWLEKARRSLARSSVYRVDYGTRRPEWFSLLNDPARLALDLPEEISSRRWDVILVDGPAGYSDDNPGRMKSIYVASKLVVPGGCVFVHDCNRAVEREYTAKFLGSERLFVQVQGRSLLNGYAF